MNKLFQRLERVNQRATYETALPRFSRCKITGVMLQGCYNNVRVLLILKKWGRAGRSAEIVTFLLNLIFPIPLPDISL